MDTARSPSPSDYERDVKRQKPSANWIVTSSTRPSGNLCIIYLSMSEKQSSINIAIVDPRPSLPSNVHEFALIRPVLQLADRFFYSHAFCVLNSVLYAFEGHIRADNPNATSVRKIDLPSIGDLTRSSEILGKNDLVEACDMRRPKILPVATPTPDDFAVEVCKFALLEMNPGTYIGEDEPIQQPAREFGANRFNKKDDEFEAGFSDDGEEENQGSEAEEVSEDENGGIQPGITKFAEGIKTFKLGFKKIVKKSGGDEDVLGPVLSAHKKLVAEKLAEEETERKAKGKVKKEKHLIGEKGHVKVANYLDAHEKFLLGVATKGVVKLFNAVNKAQNAQRGLNPSRSKDEKVIKKRRKEVFFSELGRTPSQSTGTVVKVGTSGGSADGEAPAWAPLRDNYMLTNPKLKDWDKMQDTNGADNFGRHSDADSSSDED